MQRTCEMMVINDVIPAFWTTNHGNHVFAEKLSSPLRPCRR
jgi:hypothetical protein